MLWNEPLDILVRLFSRRGRHRGIEGRRITFGVDVHLLELSPASREHVDDVAAQDDQPVAVQLEFEKANL